jgi:hypothetical protein
MPSQVFHSRVDYSTMYEFTPALLGKTTSESVLYNVIPILTIKSHRIIFKFQVFGPQLNVHVVESSEPPLVS